MKKRTNKTGQSPMSLLAARTLIDKAAENKRKGQEFNLIMETLAPGIEMHFRLCSRGGQPTGGAVISVIPEGCPFYRKSEFSRNLAPNWTIHTLSRAVNRLAITAIKEKDRQLLVDKLREKLRLRIMPKKWAMENAKGKGGKVHPTAFERMSVEDVEYWLEKTEELSLISGTTQGDEESCDVSQVTNEQENANG